jgi:hypothetical protein
LEVQAIAALASAAFEEPVGHKGEPVLQAVPAHDGVSDCTDAIMRVITNLAAIEDRSAVDMLDDVLRQAPPEALSANGAHDARRASEQGNAHKAAHD